MRIVTSLLAITLLGVGAASAQVNLPNPGAPGMSPDTAVRIVATNDLMVDRYIKRWLRQHYPDWDAEPHQFMEIGLQRYAVVYITHATESGRRVYFRVKNNMRDDDMDDFPPL